MQLVAPPARQQHYKERAHVWRHSEELRGHPSIPHRPNDGGQEEGERVDGRYYSKEHNGEDNCVNVEQGAANPVPVKPFFVDGGSGSCAVGVQAHTCNTGSFLLWAEELNVAGRMWKKEEHSDPENNSYRAFDEEDEGLKGQSEEQNGRNE
jgi:hypothetical protein